MYYFILTIHFILCFILIGLVLVQQGKGADMGAAFGGGASNTFFGAGGATAFITKLTTSIAVAFMVTSIGLIYFDPVTSGSSAPQMETSDVFGGLLQPQRDAGVAPAQESSTSPVENSSKK